MLLLFYAFITIYNQERRCYIFCFMMALKLII